MDARKVYGEDVGCSADSELCEPVPDVEDLEGYIHHHPEVQQ